MSTQRREINIDILPEGIKKELQDFYEFLLEKYKIELKTDRNKKDKILKKKKLFFDSIDKLSFKLPSDYKFSRDELYER